MKVASFLIVFGVTGFPAGVSAESRLNDDVAMNQLVFLSQSKGRGVPTASRQALADIVALMKKAGLSPTQEPWGLEGEKRVCLGLSDEELDALLPELDAIRDGVELLQMEIRRDVDAPCGRTLNHGEST